MRQGITPERLAWSLALGMVIGLFPVVGTTTLLCTAVALGLRLNLVAIQTANYAVYPLQLLLLLPFMRGGERLTGAEPLPLGGNELVELLKTEGWRALLELGASGVHAIAAWSLVAPPLALALVALMTPLLRRLSRRRSSPEA